MSTRCNIGILNENGTVSSIYCHHDGYIEYVGKCLVDYYTDENKIRKLIALGDISAIGTEPVDNPDGWSVSAAHELVYREDMCTTYRTRGEDCPPVIDANVSEYYDNGEEYIYLYKNKEWYLVKKNAQGGVELLLVKDFPNYKNSQYFKN